MDTYNISITIITLLLSAIFAGLELAFLASDKLIIELEGNKNTLTSKVMRFLLKHPSHILGSTLICTTISVMIYTSSMTELLESFLKPVIPTFLYNDFFLLLVNTIIITIITLLFAEFIPKSIIILNPNRFLHILSIPLWTITILLYPVVSIIIYISKFLLKYIFKQSYTDDKHEFELQDVHSFLKKTLEHEDNSPTTLRAKMASNVIDFKKVRVRTCMVPRTEVIALDVESNIKTLTKAFIESEHSKVLVYKNDIDNIIGYCYLKDLLKKPKDIKNILNPISIFPETSYASEVMFRFITEHKSLALIVDEFGGTAGIVTMEDIIEEIFGEIQDEHDTEELIESKVSDDIFVLSARHEINYLNEKYNWNLPKGEYDTLGGLITNIAGKIPGPKETIQISDFKFIILSKKQAHINTVKIILKKNK